MIIVTWTSKLNSYLIDHPWIIRAIYGCFLLLWAACLAPTAFRYPWASSSFTVPYAVLFVTPLILLLAHLVWCSFWSWLFLVAVYLAASLFWVIQSIQSAVSYVPVKWDAFTAWENILIILVIVAVPLTVFALTMPPWRGVGLQHTHRYTR
jgi:hypothetical protein